MHSSALPPPRLRDRLYRVRSVVIGRSDLGETDRIFTLFSRERGKIRAVGKGVRKPGSRLGAGLEYFCHGDLTLSRGRNLDVITSATVMQRFPEIQADIRLLAHGSHLLELTNRLAPENHALPELFDLLIGALGELEGARNAFAVARYFEVAALAVLGYRMELYRCTQCASEIEQIPNFVDAHSGGMLCPGCARQLAGSSALSVNAQKYLRALDRGGLSSVISLCLTSDLESELERVMTTYLQAIAERDLASLRVLREMGPTYSAAVEGSASFDRSGRAEVERNDS